MFLAAKFAKKKYKERQQRNIDAEPEQKLPQTYPPPLVSNAEPAAAAPPLPTTLNITPSQEPSRYNEPIFTQPDSHPPKPSTSSDDDTAETPEEKAEKKRRRTYRYKIIFGLFMPYTLQALDTTIIASALPFIAQDFGQITQLNWIITSFNLTAAAFLPFWAQIADIYGRFATLLAGIAIISIGSAICTAAPTTAFPALLLGRALQGVGASSINICSRTILADRVSLAEYAKNWTVFAMFSAVGFAVGPVAGGYLTKTSWRWCFGINLPVAFVAVILVFVLLKGELLGPQPVPEIEETEEGRRRLRTKETKRGRFLLRLMTIDYGGQLLFLFGIGLLVLALTWAGSRFAWSSAAVIAPLVVGGVLTGCFLFYEYAMSPGHFMSRLLPLQRAMIPWQLITQPDMGLLFLINFVMGVAMFAVMYFMDLYFALVLHRTSEESGLALLYFLSGLGPGAFSANFFMNIFPRRTAPTLLLATTTTALGLTLLAYATHIQSLPFIYGMMALTGFGVGLSFNPGSLHALAYFPGMTAPIQCMVAFANPFGGTVGLTVMSTVFGNKSQGGEVREGIMWAFVAVVPLVWMGVVGSLFLGDVRVGVGRGKEGHEVVEGAWILGGRKRRGGEVGGLVERGEVNGGKKESRQREMV